MIYTMIPTIAASFLLLVGLLLWLVIGTKGSWKIKLPIIVVVPLVTFAVWSALGSFTGWPASASLPKNGLYVSGYVVEPEPGLKGAIYIWEIPPPEHGLLTYRNGIGEPRSYKLPYTRQMHEEIDHANRLKKKGLPVTLKKMPVHKRGVRGHIHYPKNTYRAYVLPTAAPPVKPSPTQ